MCTGDNVLTAHSIALQCGIFTSGGIIMEGPVFRQLLDKEMLEIVPRIQVLARSSPEDKKLLVAKLHAYDEIVGITDDGTNDILNVYLYNCHATNILLLWNTIYSPYVVSG